MSRSSGTSPFTSLNQLQANLRDPTWHSIRPPSLADACKAYKRNKDYRSIAEEGLFGKDYGGRRIESCIEQLKRNYSWMGDKVGEVVAEAKVYPLPLDHKKLSDLKDRLDNISTLAQPLANPFETVKPSSNFFKFQGSTPDDYDSDAFREGLDESIEHASISEVSHALQKVHLAVEVQIAEHTLAKELAHETATNRINLPWERIILPSDPSRIYGDWETLRTMPEFLEEPTTTSKSPSSLPFIFVFSLSRLSREPDDWFPNDAATTRDVQHRLQGLVIAGFNAAAQYGYPLDRVLVVPALQVAGLAVPVAGWHLFDHRIIPAQFQGVTHVPNLHLFDLIVVYGSTGAGQLFLDPGLILLLIGILFPNIPANIPPPIPPPPPPAAPGLPPPPPPPPPPPAPNQPPLPPANNSDDEMGDVGNEVDEDDDDSSDGSDGRPRGQGVVRAGSESGTLGKSQVGKGKGKGRVDEGKGEEFSEEDRREAFKNSGAVKRFKPSAQFCFILTEGTTLVEDFWSSMCEFMDVVNELRTKGRSSDPETELMIRDLLAHLVGRQEASALRSEGMKAARAFVKEHGHSSWRGRNKNVQKIVAGKKLSTHRITSESLASPSLIPPPRSHSRSTSPRASTSTSSTEVPSNTSSSAPVPPRKTQKGSSMLLSVPPVRSNSRIRAAKPWDLTQGEQQMLEGYPSPEDVIANQRQVKLADFTVADYFNRQLDVIDQSMVTDMMNLSGNLKSLVCGVRHTIEGSTKKCRDSFHEHQRGLLEFHQLYHSKWSDEIQSCTRCYGKLPMRFLSAHMKMCNGQWNEGAGDAYWEEGNYRKNEFTFWFRY